MATDILEKILTSLLSYYLSLDETSLKIYLDAPNTATKERVDTIGDLKVIIWPNDHNPPHFHVISKQRNINARFKIENCELMDGEISAKDLKRIEAFYAGPKGKITLQTIWKKYTEKK